MWEIIIVSSLTVSFLAFIEHLYKSSKIKKILLADKCAECPFMRQIELPNEVSYTCSARMESKYYESLNDMNNDCEFGGKIEIKISKK